MDVAVSGEREEPGRRVAAREEGMPEPRDAAPAAVLQLLRPEHEHHVVRPRRDREAAVPECIRPRRAVVLDPRDGAVVEPECVGERDGRLPPPRPGEIRAEVRRLDLGGIDARIVVRLERGVADELLVAPLEAVAELRTADADDRDAVLHRTSTGRAFQK